MVVIPSLCWDIRSEEFATRSVGAWASGRLSIEIDWNVEAFISPLCRHIQADINRSFQWFVITSILCSITSGSSPLLVVMTTLLWEEEHICRNRRMWRVFRPKLCSGQQLILWCDGAAFVSVEDTIMKRCLFQSADCRISWHHWIVWLSRVSNNKKQ